MDPVNWRAPHVKNQFVHTRHHALRKCCGCIHLRVGAALSCLVWIGLSLYLAILSFQEKSPFFSYMAAAPLYVFAVASIILSIVGFIGLFVLFRNRWEYIRLYSRIVWTALFIFLIDGLANACYFITQRGDFMSWCIDSTADYLSDQVTLATNGTTNGFNYRREDFYNCQRLYQDECKFGLISIFLMIVLYIYWGLCIYSFSHKQGVSNMEMASRLEFGLNNPRRLMTAGPGMAMPPPLSTGPIGRAAGPGRSNVIVLNNEPPSSSTKNNKEKSDNNSNSNISNKKKTRYFSMRSLRKKPYQKNSIRHQGKSSKLKRKSVPDDLLYSHMDPQDAHKNQRRRSSPENY